MGKSSPGESPKNPGRTQISRPEHWVTTCTGRRIRLLLGAATERSETAQVLL